MKNSPNHHRWDPRQHTAASGPENAVPAATARRLSGDWSPSSPPRPLWRRALPGSRNGVILVITLLATLLLAAIVFFVINVGHHANTRLITQHSADSAAIAGAGWVARSFNTVAMNNVAISRHIALASTLDALPLSTHASLLEQTFFRDRLDTIGNISTPNPRLTQVANQQLELLLTELNEEVAILEPMDLFFTQNDVRQITYYAAPTGARGALWNAMQSLDEFNQTVMENLAPLAVLNASRGGVVNLESGLAESAAFMLPLHPDIPWQRGHFDDFERPVTRGQLPDELDEPINNRGPYDAVFGWRDPVISSDPPSRGGGVNSTSGITDGGSILGGGTNNSGYGGGQHEIIGYRTYGTLAWSLRQIAGFVHSHQRPNLEESRYTPFTYDQSNNKISYLWPQEHLQGPRRFALPKWEARYPSVQELAVGPTLPMSETALYRLEIKSRYPRTSGQFMTDPASWWYDGESRFSGTYDPNDSTIRIVGRRSDDGAAHRWGSAWWLHQQYTDTDGVRRFRHLPQEMQGLRGEVTQIGANAWLYEYEYTVIHDDEIGIQMQVNEQGIPTPQTAYFLQLFIYAGINTHPARAGVFDPQPYGDYPQVSVTTSDTDSPPVANPYAVFDKTAAEAPAPVDFDHTIMGVQSAERATRLSFLSVARMSDRALLWPARFTSNTTYPYKVALASADVFNDHSWDLWTQMWHAQPRALLTADQPPIEGPPARTYEEWLAVLETDSADGLPPIASPEELQDLYKYLHSLRELAPLMLTH